MVDLGVALTWIALSAASVKGLTAFARASAASDTEEELVPLLEELPIRVLAAGRRVSAHPPTDVNVASA